MTLKRVIFTLFLAGGAALYGILVVKFGIDTWNAKTTPDIDAKQAGVVVAIGLVLGPAVTTWMGITASQGGNSLAAEQRSALAWLGRFFLAIANIRFVGAVAVVGYLAVGGFAGVVYLHSSHTPSVLLGIAAAWGTQAIAIMTAAAKEAFRP
jgi:hypothetical protein